MRQKILPIILLALSGCASVDTQPQDVVELFYKTDLNASRRLIVEEDVATIENYESLVSKNIARLYVESVEAFKNCLAVTKPDEKPYMLEIYLATLEPEYFDNFLVKELRKDDAKAKYQVDLKNSEYPDSNLSNTIYLTCVDSKWEIVDVKNGNGSSLVEILTDYIALSRAECKP